MAPGEISAPVATKAPTLILAASLAANALLVAVVVINDPWLFPFGKSNGLAEVRAPAARPALSRQSPRPLRTHRVGRLAPRPGQP
jgi:hypothetical protein